MSDSSGSSIEFVPQSQSAHQRTSTSAWHAQLLDGRTTIGEPSQYYGGPSAVAGQQAAAPRARRASEAPAVQQRPHRNSNDDSSLVFEMEESGIGGTGLPHTVGESSIEFDTMLSPVTQDGTGLRRLATSSAGHAQRQRGRGAGVGAATKRKQTSGPRSPTRQSQEVGTDPLERLYHVGLDRKLAKQQWACLERAKRRSQEEDLDSCTFRPQLSPMATAIRRPRSLSPQHRADDEVRRKIVWRAAQKREAMERELSECTFKPLTLSAAKLHASAIVHRTDLHDKLHNDEAKRRAFRDDVQLQAVKALEEKMLYKRGVPKRAKRSSSGSDGEGTEATTLLTAEDVNAIVERLLHTSIHHANDDPKARGETFHPTINPTSAKIAQQIAARGRSESPEERRSARPAAMTSDSREAKIGAMRSNLAYERRKHHACLVFNMLAEYVFEQQRRKNTPSGEPLTPPLTLGEEVLGQCELPISALLTAGTQLFPATTSTGDDIVRALSMCSKQQLKRVSRETFATSLLHFTPFTSVDAMGRRADSLSRASAAEEPLTRLQHGQTYERQTTSDGPTVQKDEDADARHRRVVARLLERQRQTDERIMRERQQRLEEEDAAVQRATTFKPQINRRRSNSMVTGAVQQELTGDAASMPNGNRKRHSSISEDVAVLEKPHHVPLRQEVELTAQPTPTAVVAAAANASGSGRRQSDDTKRSSVEWSTRHDCVSRDVISEHAAFGSSSALKDFGMRMMRKQLGQHAAE